MTAAEVVSGMPDNERPVNARQAVELARVPEADRAEVWRAANDATDGKPTAAAIRAAATPDSPTGPDALSVLVSVGETDTTGDHDPDEFAAVLDRLVPDSNPHREWQRRFLDTIAGTYKITRFTPEDVVERAGEQLVAELIRAVDSLADYRDRVVKAHLLSIPNNVTPIRRAQ
jgi:hypothetical protein